MECWEAVHENIPLKVLATCQLLRVSLRDPLATPCPDSIPALGALSEPELASGYALAVLRCAHLETQLVTAIQFMSLNPQPILHFRTDV